MARHATREEELDELLRERVFVDLYRAVRQGLRVGAESYSIKKLEPLYAYKREIELRDANSSIVEFESLLEDGDPDGSIVEKIRLYNRDDCISTEKLRDWLELRRAEAERQLGFVLPRPSGEIDAPDPEFTARQQAGARSRGAPDCFDPWRSSRAGRRRQGDLVDASPFGLASA